MKKNVVLITGGATRLAKEIAISLTENNYLVVVHYNSSKKEAINLKESLGDKCEIIQYDFLSNHTKSFFNDVLNIFGRLDYIINAASIFTKQGLDEIDEELLIKYNVIHSYVPLLLTNYLYEDLLKKERIGAVINITDAGLENPSLNRVPYYLSKESLSFQTRLLAKELSPIVRVNEIAPGLIMASHADKSYFSKMETKNKMGIGNSYDIINTILYLLKANYVTGEKIKVDGGLYF